MIGAGDKLSIAANMLNGGLSKVVNVFKLSVSSLASQTQAQIRADIAEYVEGIFTDIISEMEDALSFDNIDIYNLTGNIIEPQIEWPTLTQGGNAAAPLPIGCAALVLARTGVSRHIGRKFFGTLVEGRATGSFWDSTMIGKLLLALGDYMNVFTGSNGVGLTPGVQEILLGGGLGVFRPFIGGSVQAQVAYQRRRKFGVGS